MICDFCNAPVPDDEEHTVFTSRPISYTVIDTTYMDSVDWAACDTCKALIEAEDKEGLIQRIIASFKERHPQAWRPDVEPLLREYNGKFWKYYIRMDKEEKRNAT